MSNDTRGGGGGPDTAQVTFQEPLESKSLRQRSSWHLAAHTNLHHIAGTFYVDYRISGQLISYGYILRALTLQRNLMIFYLVFFRRS